MREPVLHLLDFLLGMLRRDAALQPPEHFDLLAGFARVLQPVDPQRQPDLLGAREFEAGRQHAHDLGRHVVGADRAADHAGVRGEPRAPRVVAEDHRVRPADRAFVVVEPAAQDRADAEQAHGVGRDVRALVALRPTGAAEIGRAHV